MNIFEYISFHEGIFKQYRMYYTYKYNKKKICFQINYMFLYI